MNTSPAATTTGTPPTWRDHYQVHPCAAVFPMLLDDDLSALAADIQANGLREPAILWMDPSDNRLYLLDGRNRLEALARAGIDLSAAGQTTRISEPPEIVDPAAFVISRNIRRRHLTKAQQAELIVRAIQAGKNDAATVARSFSPNIGQRGGSSQDPVLHAAIQEGQKQNISKRTIHRARAKVRGVTTRPRTTPRKKRISSRAKPTSEGRPLETSKPSATAASVSKRIKDAMMPVELAIQRAVARWPPGSSLEPLIQFLHLEADRLATRDEATP